MLLVFFYAPEDADQGFRQKIFYVHVPMAIVTLCGFIAGGLFAIKHLRTGDSSWDMRSYVAIHLSIMLGVGVLLTGAIWAKTAWGHWWVWDEPVLVSYLIVFLLYCCYQPLRFSIADPERQSRYASVFAITAGAFVPLNFVAVRLAEQYTHPRVLSETGGNMPGDMRFTFFVCIAADGASVHDALEARADEQAHGPAAEAPAPATGSAGLMLVIAEGGDYVAAAYIVFLTLIVVYIAIIASKLSRMEKELETLNELVDKRGTK